MSDNKKIKPDGMITFKPNDNAPDFVKGTLVITPKRLFAWIKENADLLTEYNGEKQLKLQILEGDYGLYFPVDTFKPTNKPTTKGKKVEVVEDEDDLPF